jgi:prepilin-type N-terminal cleavage/methylation domain-containing protein
MTNGYTLIEVIVVLVLMALAAALVAPAFVTPHRPEAAIMTLIGQARALAIRRAEAMELRIEVSGAWRLDGGASQQAGPVATGAISPAPAAALTLVFSPLGSCASDVATASAAEPLHLDPLTCEAAP